MTESTTTPTPIPAGSAEGIDVSHGNGPVSWTAAASGLKFAFAKATDGHINHDGSMFVDPQFATNWAAMRDVGLVRGAYHYFQPGVDAALQAAHFIAHVRLEPGDLPPILDLEQPPTAEESRTLQQNVQTWLDVVEKAFGALPMIYVSPSFWDQHMNDQLGHYPLWVADWNTSQPLLPKGWKQWTFWQYTNGGSAPGIASPVDRNRCPDLSKTPRVGGPAPTAARARTSTPPPSTCGLDIPARPAGALTGSQLAGELHGLSQPVRDQRVLGELLAGNLPDFMRALVEVTVRENIGGTDHTVVYRVTPDYLSVGSDEDYLRMPMTPLTAQTAGEALGCSLPTRKMVNQIYAAATAKIAPLSFDPQNGAFPVFVESNTRIEKGLAVAQPRPGALVGGDKKDVVITAQLATNPDRVAIYGWHELDGKPIQPLFLGHGIWYMDYSHGIRMVLDTVTVDGTPMRLTDLLAHRTLSALVSDEGPVATCQYHGRPTIPLPPPPSISPTPPLSSTPSTPEVPSTPPSPDGLVSLPAGTLGLDRSLSIGPEAAALFGDGYRFALRNVNLPGHGDTGVLTSEEVAQIRAAGLALGLYQTFRQHGVTPDQGTADGQLIADAARSLGFPPGVTLWCDLESSAELHGTFFDPDGEPVSAQTMIAYLESWARVVTTAGYGAGLYNGPQALLSGAELSSLSLFSAFWRAESGVPDPDAGYQLKQQHANKVVSGVNIDEDVVERDARGVLPVFWMPSGG